MKCEEPRLGFRHPLGRLRVGWGQLGQSLLWRRLGCCFVAIHELKNGREDGSGWDLRAVVGKHTQSLKRAWCALEWPSGPGSRRSLQQSVLPRPVVRVALG